MRGCPQSGHPPIAAATTRDPLTLLDRFGEIPSHRANLSKRLRDRDHAHTRAAELRLVGSWKQQEFPDVQQEFPAEGCEQSRIGPVGWEKLARDITEGFECCWHVPVMRPLDVRDTEHPGRGSVRRVSGGWSVLTWSHDAVLVCEDDGLDAVP